MTLCSSGLGTGWDRCLRISRLFACAGLLCALFPAPGLPETRLFVPLFRYGPAEDTHLLIANQGAPEALVDLWAFRSDGGLLGQVQLWDSGSRVEDAIPRRGIPS